MAVTSRHVRDWTQVVGDHVLEATMAEDLGTPTLHGCVAEQRTRVVDVGGQSGSTHSSVSLRALLTSRLTR